MWDLPGPGLEPVSPALADGFLTTAPPGKPLAFVLETVHLEFLDTQTNGSISKSDGSEVLCVYYQSHQAQGTW